MKLFLLLKKVGGGGGGGGGGACIATGGWRTASGAVRVSRGFSASSVARCGCTDGGCPYVRPLGNNRSPKSRMIRYEACCAVLVSVFKPTTNLVCFLFAVKDGTCFSTPHLAQSAQCSATRCGTRFMFLVEMALAPQPRGMEATPHSRPGKSNHVAGGYIQLRR